MFQTPSEDHSQADYGRTFQTRFMNKGCSEMKTDSEKGEATTAIDSEKSDLGKNHGESAAKPKEYFTPPYFRTKSSPAASFMRLEQSPVDDTRIHPRYTDHESIDNEHESNYIPENTVKAAENDEQTIKKIVRRNSNERSRFEYDRRRTLNRTLNLPGMKRPVAVVQESIGRPASAVGKVSVTRGKQTDAVATSAVRSEHEGQLNRRFLEMISRRSVNSICQEFKKHKEEFVHLMRRCSKDTKTIAILLNIFAKISSSNSDSVITLIGALQDSHFIEHTVVPFLLSLIGSCCKNIEIVMNTIRLVVCMANNSISSIVSFYSILTALAELTAEIREKEICTDRIQSEIEEFDQIKLRIHTIRRNADKKKRTKEDLTKPPDNFRTINVAPTAEDLLTAKQPFIRKNKAFGSFVDLEHYLDVQFRLLREDYIAPLRESIQEYKSSSKDNQSGKKRISDIRIYLGVKVAGTTMNADGIGHILTFDTSTTTRVNWEYSKRLAYGSLLCLSDDNFNTIIFATVINRNAEDLALGILEVQLDCDTELLHNLFSKVFIMAESNTYFEAYKHNLTALQNIKALAFSKYIVSCNEKIDPPAYLLKDTNTAYDMSLVVIDDFQFQTSRSGEVTETVEHDTEPQYYNREEAKHKKIIRGMPALRNIPIFLDGKWPDASTLNLDESQYRAVKNALTHEFSITQGPPGTGKTFVGLKIAKTLLLNKRYWACNGDQQPMLIVCYTNHALDQFLCGIYKFFKGNIVRVGGRSSNEIMQEHGIRTMYKYISDEVLDGSSVLGRIKSETETRIAELKSNLFLADRKILHETQLRKYARARLYHSLMFGFGVLVFHTNRNRKRQNKLHPDQFNVMEEWLGNGRLAEKCKDQVLFQAEDSTDFDNLHGTNFDANDFYDRIGCIPKNEIKKFQERAIQDIPVKKGQRNKVKTKASNQSKERVIYYSKIVPAESDDVMKIKDVWLLPHLRRWQLYKRWISHYKHDLKERLKEYEEDYEMVCKQITEINKEKQRQALSQADVIGMTTTGAAKHFDVLQAVKPKIVIVEEAAEVLEAHIVTSLSEHCEHLILIGDHKQLKPSPAVYKLAVKYNLEVSLFERMINNKVKFECLEYQHRMRPEISKIIRLFYPDLKDDQSVMDRPNIKGVASSVFFISHSHPEQHDEENTSHSNMFEAEFLVALCRYLLKQQYKPSQITVLTTYSAQMFLLRRMMPKEGEFHGVNITVVDNYQGEENDIILLSLVRSNPDEKIGFLKIENRVNVALSRARNGLYVVGNFETMSKVSEIWSKIKTLLEHYNQFGPAIPLFCRNHPKNQLFASKAEDFLKAPEGGCFENCEARLDCGHACRLKCHVYDTDHMDYRCQADCNERCPNGHQCMDRCYEKCRDCPVLMHKIIPKCGHLQRVKCHIPPNKFKCQVDCEEVLSCGHKCTSKCHQESHECFQLVTVAFESCDHVETVYCCKRSTINKCEQPCQFILPCQHICAKKCFQPHTSLCEEEVSIDLSCGHSVVAPCHISAENIECTEPCETKLSCGHSCKEVCGKPHTTSCDETVFKKLKCGHTMPLFCSDNPDNIICRNACTKRLPCGHTCANECHEAHTTECDGAVRYKCKYGHTTRRRCYDVTMKIQHECKKHCRENLACGHSCRGTCFECDNGNFHKPCDICGVPDKTYHISSCGRSKRYPCVAPCRNQCSHRKCNKFCFEPCSDDGSMTWICDEKCGWACEHKSCSKLCREVCDRELCKLPCEKLLRYHSEKCQGYCGETCGHEKSLPSRRGIGFGSPSPENFKIPLTYNSKQKTFLKYCKHAVDKASFETKLGNDSSNCGPTCPIPRCNAPVFIDENMFGNIVRKKYEVKERRKMKSEFYERHRELKGIFTVLEEQLRMMNIHDRSRESLAEKIQNRKRSFDNFLHFQRQGYKDLKKELLRLQYLCTKSVDMNKTQNYKELDAE